MKKQWVLFLAFTLVFAFAIAPMDSLANERFVQTVDDADYQFLDQGYEAANYWVEQAEISACPKLSYFIDLGDLHHRMDNPRDGLTYYFLAHNLRKRIAKNNIQLAKAFIHAGKLSTAEYYLDEALKLAKKKSEILTIGNLFKQTGNQAMAKQVIKRGNLLRQ